jgi:protein TonB
MNQAHHSGERRAAFVLSLAVHLVVLIALHFLNLEQRTRAEYVELDWAGSSGAPGKTIKPETEQREEATDAAKQPSRTTPATTRVNAPVAKNLSRETVSVKEKGAEETSRVNAQPSRRAERAARRQAKAEASGAGSSTGYSIEWAGVGSRRLLSGRIPEYPDGTTREMPVLLQFTVLPDGSVSNVLPLARSDELLERAAIEALRTWRFDPLPPVFEQKPQMGKITFVFKLE